MDFLYIFAVAIGLSMDAFAVSVNNGFLIKDLKLKHSLRISFSFGLFQAVMPVLGWLCGVSLLGLIQKIDHWIAFVLLAGIGTKMIVESIKNRKASKARECETKNCTHFPTLILMSIATSVDALAIGLTFGVLDVPFLVPVIIIGIVTFAVCLAGIYLGNKVGHLFENKLEIIGGIILILIGIKILIEHLLAG
ncbi:MAG: manganese efflux pump [Spirochaetales bacterium]|nr:manganese efflux pump [Spirochaetales bacterium]